MTDLPNEKQGSDLQEGACAENAMNVENAVARCALKDSDGNVAMKNAAASSAATSARIKRMRGWLGVKSTSPLHGYDDGGGGVVYGDGHSGWNR